LLTIAACESFPHDGPSIDAVRQHATSGRGGYSLVELDARTSAIIAATPAEPLASLGEVGSAGPVDRIGVGDGLAVTVFEHGAAALFGTTVGVNGEARGGATEIPKLFVDPAGNIALPFGGEVHVAGLTPTQAARAIVLALKGKAIDPQVVVNISDNVANSVAVLGEVRNPGRYPLSEGGDRLLDVVTLAAGPTKPAADLRVVVVRGQASAAIPLAELLQDSRQNIRLAPHDQVRLVFEPRKFSTFGALAHPAQVPIEDDTLTLAGALGRVGGLDPTAANASAVLVFRFERPEVASALGVDAPASSKGVPVVYRLNLRNPAGVFVANRFEIQSDDIIYVPRADTVELMQFIGLVSAVSTVAYNARVTSVLP
jgi:polysaccharide export outer membrane protein